MRDYRFDFDPVVPAGRVVFEVYNMGKTVHDFRLYPLSEDVPPIEVQVHGPYRISITPLVLLPPAPPGSRQTVAADLVPGQRYGLLCFERTGPPDDRSHTGLGMASEFRAGFAGRGRP
ncbi:MAG TPA: hypothetical protein VFJ85_06395 [Acidimicrobiales bacterium]|nr:hypothetical protein [Acidimicrobiales bacterium]